MKQNIKTSLLVLTIIFSSLSFGQTKRWTLEECVGYAFQNNISIKQSQLDLKTSDIEKLEAIGGFLPSINGNANYSVNTGANINPATNQFENETFKSFSANANANVNLFNGLRNWKTLQRTKLNAVANSYKLDKMRDDIALNIANSYLQILFNKEQIKVLQNQKAITQQNIDRTKQLIDAGSIPAGDIYELNATLATQEQQIIAAENTLLIAKINLCQTLLLEDYVNFDIADEEYQVPVSPVFGETPDAIIAKAKESVKDVKIAAANLDVAKKDVSVSRSAYLPTLSAFLGYNTRWSDNAPISFNNQISLFDGTSYGLQLNVPILNGLSVRTRVQHSKINVERADFLLKQAELDLERNVYQAYSDVSNARKSFEAAQKTLEARQKANEFSKDRYEIGMLNAFDFAQSTTAFVSAQSEVLRTKYDYIFRTKILEFYFGIPIIQKQ
ncbi:MAG: TolC family protein [Flavobacterium sp.]